MEEPQGILTHEQEKEKEEKKKKKAEKEAAKEDYTIKKLMLAYERTLIAWIKIATHLLIFGFALYQLLQAKLQDGGEHPILQVITPRRLALILFAAGFFSLLMATIRFVQIQKRFTKFSRFSYLTPILILAYIILILLFTLSLGLLMGK